MSGAGHCFIRGVACLHPCHLPHLPRGPPPAQSSLCALCHCIFRAPGYCSASPKHHCQPHPGCLPGLPSRSLPWQPHLQLVPGQQQRLSPQVWSNQVVGALAQQDIGPRHRWALATAGSHGVRTRDSPLIERDLITLAFTHMCTCMHLHRLVNLYVHAPSSICIPTNPNIQTWIRT